MERHFKIADNLYLIEVTLPKTATVVASDVIHHIVTIDCSGSMGDDLPLIREQLKLKLPKLLGEKDTITILWFSGKDQFGVLIEAEPVANLVGLAEFNKRIDRWLKPVGLTSFLESLQSIPTLVRKILQTRYPGVINLFFMSDGCNNDAPRQAVIKAAAQLEVSSATFVEYGYHADRALLTTMAEEVGGTLIYADDFHKYEPVFENSLTQRIPGAPRHEFRPGAAPIGGFVYALSQGDLSLITCTVDELGQALVPGYLDTIYYLSTEAVGEALASQDVLYDEDALYAALSLYATRMQPDVIYSILRKLGDVKLIKDFAGCFGKQKYTDFQELAKAAAFNAIYRYQQGYDPNAVPDANAFTVLDLLALLTPEDRILIDHPAFTYKRISRGRVAASLITPEEIQEAQELAAHLGDDPKALNDLRAKLDAMNSKQPLKFEADPMPDGYSPLSLTYADGRANISILVKKIGHVYLPVDSPAGLPAPFPTFIYRNYPIVADGRINVEQLPVKLSDETEEKIIDLMSIGDISHEVFNFKDGIFHLTKLPLINQLMIKQASALDMFNMEYSLLDWQAAQKVFNHYKKEHFPRESKSFAMIYGDTAVGWLKERGITDYSGFSPKTVQAESTDYVMVKELKTKLKGLSSLPSVKDVIAQIEKGKYTAGGELMVSFIKEVDDFMISDIYNNAPNKDKLFEAWLDGKAQDATAHVRELISELARIKFAIIVGQVWFTEFSSLDQNSMTIQLPDGDPLFCEVEMKEVKVNL